LDAQFIVFEIEQGSLGHGVKGEFPLLAGIGAPHTYQVLLPVRPFRRGEQGHGLGEDGVVDGDNDFFFIGSHSLRHVVGCGFRITE
jgi:hypothetical protein